MATESVSLRRQAEFLRLKVAPSPAVLATLGRAGTAGSRALHWGVMAAVFGLAGCAQSPSSGFSFAAQTGHYEPKGTATSANQAQFGAGEITLVAPPGHCIDISMLRQDNNGGFALLPRCNLLQGSSWFGRNRAAVITATIGKAANTGAPRTADIARTAQGAKLLYYDDKGVLPLVRLHWPGHSASGAIGASAEHWRGAFVLNDYLVVLALYAPEGSDLLGRAGADLLTEMTLLSLNATTAIVGAAPQDAPQTNAQVADPSAKITQGANGEAQHRPKARPTTQNRGQGQKNAATTTSDGKNLSLRARIAGLFH